MAREFIQKNFTKLLKMHVAIFVVTLLVAVLASPDNKITSLVVGVTPSEESSLLFITSLYVFLANLISVVILFAVFNPQSFLVRANDKYAKPADLMRDFMSVSLRCHAVLTSKQYSLYLVNSLQTKYGSKYSHLRYLSFVDKGETIAVSVDEKINDIQNKELLSLLHIIADAFSGPSKTTQDEDMFRTLLKQQMPVDLKEALVTRGFMP